MSRGLPGRMSLRRLRWLLALGTIASCAKVPLVGGPAEAKLTVSGTTTLNDCGKGAAAPLTLHLVQVTDASALTGATLAQTWGREDKLLGPAFLASAPQSLDPGTKREFSVELKPETKAVVVIGNFCRTEGSCWYHVAQRKGGGGVKVRLSADASCLRPAR